MVYGGLMDIMVFIIGIVIGFIAGVFLGMHIMSSTHTVEVRSIPWDDFDDLDDIFSDFDDEFDDEFDELDDEFDSMFFDIETVDLSMPESSKPIGVTVNVNEFQFFTVSLVDDDTYPFPTPGTEIVYPKYTEQELEAWADEQDAAYDEIEEELRVFGKS